MGLFIKLNSLLLFIVLSSIQPDLAEAAGSKAIPREYTATYKVLHNGNRLANVTVRLSHRDDIWTLHGFTHDTRGLAGVLNVRGVQTTTGKWQDGRFYPDDYRFSFSLIGYKSAWLSDFDWPSGTVTSSGRKWDKKLSLEGGAIDPFSLSLNIRALLTESPQHMAINVLDEDKIDQQEYQSDRNEMLDTALGCMNTTRVKRMRSNAKRTSMFWYAHDHDYVPILILHSKKNGNDFKLKIISLDIGGQLVEPVSHC